MLSPFRKHHGCKCVTKWKKGKKQVGISAKQGWYKKGRSEGKKKNGLQSSMGVSLSPFISHLFEHVSTSGTSISRASKRLRYGWWWYKDWWKICNLVLKSNGARDEKNVDIC